MQNDLGVNALVSGLVMMPSGIAMGILNPVAGKSFSTVAIVCAVCLVASLFVRDRGRRPGQQR
ncbi:MAG: hypothetical protein KHX19_07845 [Bifidobacterium longum]|nr:hypothetical protein [Bifidobacterium longum]